MDPITPSTSITEATITALLPLDYELISSQQRVPLPLNTRALIATELTINFTGGGSTPECDDGRPDTGMLYPRG